MRVIRILGAAAAAVIGLSAASASLAQAAGDVALGAKKFSTTCVICHGKEGVGGALGPNLHGVIGRKAGTGVYAKYTPAMKNSPLKWTPAVLDTYLASPMKAVPGTAMVISVPNADDRKNVIAYLQTLK